MANVEKPMKISRAAIEEMLCAQQEMGVKLAVISQHRFDPANFIQSMKRLKSLCGVLFRLFFLPC